MVWKFMAIKFNLLLFWIKKGTPVDNCWKMTLTVACGIKTLLQQISRTDMLINWTVPNSVKCWQKLTEKQTFQCIASHTVILLLLSGIQNCSSEITTHWHYVATLLMFQFYYLPRSVSYILQWFKSLFSTIVFNIYIHTYIYIYIYIQWWRKCLHPTIWII